MTDERKTDGSTAGGGGSPTTIGTYLLENFSPANNGTEVRRTGTNGEDTDMAIVHKAMTASCKAQRASTSTKQPQAGDYFEEVLDGDTATTRFVLTSCSKDESAGTFHSYNFSLTQDIENSAKYTA